MHNRLYIGNLAAGVAVTTLQELFEPHGFVMDIKLGRGEKAGPPSGFAFVTMATDASATAALRALNGAVLHGAIINIEHASGDGLETDA
jgi:RNA recognition motif-containing protein